VRLFLGSSHVSRVNGQRRILGRCVTLHGTRLRHVRVNGQGLCGWVHGVLCAELNGSPFRVLIIVRLFLQVICLERCVHHAVLHLLFKIWWR
jgi:hypothetical protein